VETFSNSGDCGYGIWSGFIPAGKANTVYLIKPYDLRLLINLIKSCIICEPAGFLRKEGKNINKY
jgi:hypothetical protein